LDASPEIVTFNPDAESCRWIFAYGSLMWRPGFEYLQVKKARLMGFHRRLCVYSYHYRGTPEQPGLVLGLDSLGSCIGLAYQVADEHWPDVLDYVRKREMITGVYREIVRRMPTEHEIVEAVTYAVVKTHPQCAPVMSVSDTMTYIERGVGQSGRCTDYVSNTIQHLRGMGVRDRGLERLSPHLNLSGGMNP
jgi:glutathione-specific gamma-glutamylcyclotransferase